MGLVDDRGRVTKLSRFLLFDDMFDGRGCILHNLQRAGLICNNFLVMADIMPVYRVIGKKMRKKLNFTRNTLDFCTRILYHKLGVSTRHG
jgi:hypothetical protein